MGEIQEEIQLSIDMLLSSRASTSKLTEIRLATLEDPTLQQVLKHVRNGWPKYIKSVDMSARDFYSVRGSLSEVEGLLVLGSRIVIPGVMRHEMLEKLHDGHLGLNKYKSRAEEAVWWHGIVSIALHKDQYSVRSH